MLQVSALCIAADAVKALPSSAFLYLDERHPRGVVRAGVRRGRGGGRGILRRGGVVRVDEIVVPGGRGRGGRVVVGDVFEIVVVLRGRVVVAAGGVGVGVGVAREGLFQALEEDSLQSGRVQAFLLARVAELLGTERRSESEIATDRAGIRARVSGGF